MTATITTADGEEIPRTDICEECDREIVAELVELEGQHEIIHQARTADRGFEPVTAGQATVSYSCRCSHVRVKFGPGTTSAWDVPDGWMWDEDDEEVGDDD